DWHPPRRQRESPVPAIARLAERKKPRAPACDPTGIGLDARDRRLGWRVGGFERFAAAQSSVLIAGRHQGATQIQQARGERDDDRCDRRPRPEWVEAHRGIACQPGLAAVIGGFDALWLRANRRFGYPRLVRGNEMSHQTPFYPPTAAPYRELGEVALPSLHPQKPEP